MSTPKYLLVSCDDLMDFFNRQSVVTMNKTLLTRLRELESAILDSTPEEQLRVSQKLIADVERSSYLGNVFVRPLESFKGPKKIPLADCEHAGCKWAGPMELARYNGINGPFCPSCGNKTLKLRESTQNA